MAKDYANDRYPRGRASRKPERRFGSVTIFFIGIVFGLIVAGVLYFHSPRDSQTRKFLSERPDNAQVVDQQIKLKGVPTEKPKPVVQTQNTKAPKFDFYTVLPNDTTKAAAKEQDDSVKKIEVKKPLTMTTQGVSQTLAPPRPEPKPKAKKAVISDTDVDGEHDQAKTTKKLASAAPAKAKAEVVKSNDANLPKKYYLHIASFNDSEEADQLKAQLLLLGFDVSIQKNTKNFRNWYRVRLGPYKELFKAQQIQEQLKQSQIKSVLLQSAT